MSLAGQQHDVTPARFGEGCGDGLAPTANLPRAGRGSDDGGADRRRIFGAADCRR
jgi:hypothetical protein